MYWWFTKTRLMLQLKKWDSVLADISPSEETEGKSGVRRRFGRKAIFANFRFSNCDQWREREKTNGGTKQQLAMAHTGQANKSDRGERERERGVEKYNSNNNSKMMRWGG